MTKFLNISTDNTLGGNSSSNEVVSAQKAVKDYVDGGLSSKQDTISDLSTIRSGASAGATAVQPADLATVATTGDYDDLLNKPTIPAAQVQSDWTQADNTKVDFIKNKPSLATVATSGSYTDLSNIPTNLVTTDTAQTITGLKTLEHTTTTDVSVVGLTVKGDHLQKGVNPSSNRFNSIEFTDINDANICKFSAIQTSDGWTGFLAGAGSDPTAPSNNLLMIASGSNKLLLIPATSSHQYSAVRHQRRSEVRHGLYMWQAMERQRYVYLQRWRQRVLILI